MLPKRYVNGGAERELESNRRIEPGRLRAIFRISDDAQEMTMLDFDKCWAAVEGRDAGADGSFFYGVQDDRRLLPAGLPVAAAVARQHRVLRDDRGGGGGRVAGVQALPPDRRLDRFAACRGDREGVRAAAHQRDDAEPGRTRRRGGDQPLPLSPGVQADHRRHPARLRPHPPARPASRRSSMPAKRSPKRSMPRGSGRARAPMRPHRRRSA